MSFSKATSRVSVSCSASRAGVRRSASQAFDDDAESVAGGPRSSSSSRTTVRNADKFVAAPKKAARYDPSAKIPPKAAPLVAKAKIVPPRAAVASTGTDRTSSTKIFPKPPAFPHLDALTAGEAAMPCVNKKHGAVEKSNGTDAASRTVIIPKAAYKKHGAVEKSNGTDTASRTAIIPIAAYKKHGAVEASNGTDTASRTVVIPKAAYKKHGAVDASNGTDAVFRTAIIPKAESSNASNTLGVGSGEASATKIRPVTKIYPATKTAADMQQAAPSAYWGVQPRATGMQNAAPSACRVVVPPSAADEEFERWFEDFTRDEVGNRTTAEKGSFVENVHSHVEDAAVEDTAMEDTALEDTAVEDTAVEDTAAEDTAEEDTAVEDFDPASNYSGPLPEESLQSRVARFLEDQGYAAEDAPDSDSEHSGCSSSMGDRQSSAAARAPSSASSASVLRQPVQGARDKQRQNPSLPSKSPEDRSHSVSSNGSAASTWKAASTGPDAGLDNWAADNDSCFPDDAAADAAPYHASDSPAHSSSSSLRHQHRQMRDEANVFSDDTIPSEDEQSDLDGTDSSECTPLEAAHSSNQSDQVEVPRLGIDIGDVLITCRNRILRELPGAVQAVCDIVKIFAAENVYLVSRLRVGGKMHRMTEHWLHEPRGFLDKTEIPAKNVVYVSKIDGPMGKGVAAAHLRLSHFVDDKRRVLRAVFEDAAGNSKLFVQRFGGTLFHFQPEKADPGKRTPPAGMSSEFASHYCTVSSWSEVVDRLVAWRNSRKGAAEEDDVCSTPEDVVGEELFQQLQHLSGERCVETPDRHEYYKNGKWDKRLLCAALRRCRATAKVKKQDAHEESVDCARNEAQLKRQRVSSASPRAEGQPAVGIIRRRRKRHRTSAVSEPGTQKDVRLIGRGRQMRKQPLQVRRGGISEALPPELRRSPTPAPKARPRKSPQGGLLAPQQDAISSGGSVAANAATARQDECVPPWHRPSSEGQLGLRGRVAAGLRGSLTLKRSMSCGPGRFLRSMSLHRPARKAKAAPASKDKLIMPKRRVGPTEPKAAVKAKGPEVEQKASVTTSKLKEKLEEINGSGEVKTNHLLRELIDKADEASNNKARKPPQELIDLAGESIAHVCSTRVTSDNVLVGMKVMEAASSQRSYDSPPLRLGQIKRAAKTEMTHTGFFSDQCQVQWDDDLTPSISYFRADSEGIFQQLEMRTPVVQIDGLRDSLPAVEVPPFRIAFCTHVRDRAWQLRHALPINLVHLWAHQSWASVVLVDFGSSDDCLEFLKRDCSEALRCKLLRVYTAEMDGPYHTATAKNTAHRVAVEALGLADNDVLVNVDADNLLVNGFVNDIVDNLAKGCTAMHYYGGSRSDGTYGRIAYRVGDFLHQLRGYDEDSHPAGGHDNDLLLRLRLIPGCKLGLTKRKALCQAIPNSKADTIRSCTTRMTWEEMDAKNRITFCNRRDKGSAARNLTKEKIGLPARLAFPEIQAAADLSGTVRTAAMPSGPVLSRPPGALPSGPILCRPPGALPPGPVLSRPLAVLPPQGPVLSRPPATSRSECLSWSDPESGETIKYITQLVGDAHTGTGLNNRQLPLVVYFGGLGTTGGFEELCTNELSKLTLSPCMLAAPLKNKDQWWTLTTCTQYGWIEGEFLEHRTQALGNWVVHLAQEFNLEFVSLMGFSCGAYAATEVFAQCGLRLHCLVLGGVHGHGQPDRFEELPPQMLRRVDVWDKWEKYLNRLSQSRSVARSIYTYHHRGDKTCLWSHAQHIFNTLDEHQKTSGMSKVKRIEVSVLDKGWSTAHDYLKQAFHRSALWRHLVGTM